MRILPNPEMLFASISPFCLMGIEYVNPITNLDRTEIEIKTEEEQYYTCNQVPAAASEESKPAKSRVSLP